MSRKWISCSVADLAFFVIGGDWGKDPEKFQDEEYTEVNCIRGSEIKNWTKDKGNTAVLRLVKKSSLEKRQLREGDILIEISGGGPEQPVGRTIFIDKKALSHNNLPSVCTNFLRMYRPVETINPRFLNYFFESFYLSGKIIKYQGGSNNLRNLKYKEFEKVNVPLPPLPEQKRIVAKLDQLFAHLDSLKARLDKIPALLKDFRQAVLEKHYDMIHQRVILSDVCLKIQDGAHHSPKTQYTEFSSGLYPYVTSKNIRNNYMKLDNLTYVNEEFHNTIYPRCSPEKGDVLLTKDGANTGNVTLNEFNEPISLLSSVCLIKTNKSQLLPAYLKFFIQSPTGFRELTGEMTGTAIKRIVLKKIKSASIPCPDLVTQKSIVKNINALFAQADAIEQGYQRLKAQIDELPQAILAKAFKGELVPQLPSDGDARELLEEIKKLKAGSGAKRG